MIFSEEKYRFMFAALQEAEKAFHENEVPVGAVEFKVKKKLVEVTTKLYD